jgi:hypothetical protein
MQSTEVKTDLQDFYFELEKYLQNRRLKREHNSNEEGSGFAWLRERIFTLWGVLFLLVRSALHNNNYIVSSYLAICCKSTV